MLFLLRLAFWIMLICLLLPGSREENRRLMSSAERTVSDVRGFCQRNPEVCSDARTTMTTMLSRLKSGAELLQVWLAPEDQKAEDRPAPADAGSPRVESAPRSDSSSATPPRLIPKWQDSLNPGDKEMPWRGPARL
jgi:hypothetical protein